MAVHNFEKAIDYFKDAEKLDSLNKDIYYQKGMCYLKIDHLDKAKKEFKNCLKIEPDDEMSKKYLTLITKKEKDGKFEEFDQMLNKKRQNK